MREPVAIVGMGAVFPGAADLAAYRANLEHGVDAIGDVPAGRWDAVYYDPASTTGDRFYCRRGGFIAPSFDPVAFGIMPVAAAGAEPDQLLALSVAAAALADAGCDVPRDRTGVVLGRGGYLTPGMARLANRVRTAEQLVTTLGELLPDLDAATVAKIRAAFQARAGELGDAAIGLVPNLAASRIANRLDLRGPAYIVDAACASSLLAVDQACRELADRRCDLVLAGGVHVCHDVTFWSVFTQLGALSRTAAIRPFDRRADGILIGEGAGLVVLKRLAEAERDGDRIYAVILGTGVSSDGRESSAMRPRADGQVAALAQAWRTAEREPAQVGLVEAHGTATPAGDEVELTALARFFGAADSARPRAALGSVKSMIGHAMPAAGAAGLIKTALALDGDSIPPSLHCDEPHPNLAATRFAVPASARPWDDLPRLAGVSAFGFGGINAHIVLEAHGGSRARRRPATSATSSGVASTSSVDERPAILALRGNSIDELRSALDRGGESNVVRGEGPLRLAVLDPTPDRRALAHKVLDRGKAWRGNHDLWFAPRGLAADGGKLAFLFPGVEAAFAPAIDDLEAALGVSIGTGGTGGTGSAIAAAMATGAASPRELEQRGVGVFVLGRLLDRALAGLGVAPDAIAGHSLGEWTGMVTSEMIPPADVEGFVAALPAGSLEVPDVVFAAVGCGASGAQAALDGLDAIAVSHDNCPHQSILCGKRDRVQLAIERLAARGVLCQELPFRSGFHSPLFADYLELHRRHLEQLALQRPRVPLWSATRCTPYPDDPAAIRALAVDHLVEPVRFRELIEALYASGVRAFVQLGVGSLTGFVDDTLRGRDHLAVSAAANRTPARSDDAKSPPGGPRSPIFTTSPGLAQLSRVSAALFVDGYAVALELPRAPKNARELAPHDLAAHGLARRGRDARAAAAATAPARPLMPLELGVPLVRLAGVVPPLTLSSTTRPADVADPVVAELLATLDEAAAASRAIVDAYRAKTRPRAVTTRRTLSVDHVAALLDHCFYRQPPDWPAVSDRYPVVPMTMNIAMMIDAARPLAPDRVAVAVEDIRAYRWLAVAPAVAIELTAKVREDGAVDVEIPGYARATVRFADRYPAAPAPRLGPLVEPRPTPVTAREMYDERWMFHGPRYQGVVEMGPMGRDGVDGVIEALPAPGALLDCAGQLMGWWVMQTERVDRLAMPVKIDRIALFGPDPAPGERVACRVRMRAVREREVRADLELTAGGRIWAAIDGWEDRRFDSDDPVWAVLMYPEHHALAELQPGGYVSVAEHWRGAASRELMMRRYLGERERAAHEALGPRARRSWLLGRIAIKDAARLHAWRTAARPTDAPIWPVEIEVRNEPSGAPTITSRLGALHVSVAHKDELAVAIVDDARPVGIDVERIAPRSDAFGAIAFAPGELALGAHRDPAEWATRLWTAKEAVAKLRRTGMTDPKQLVVRATDGDRLYIASPTSGGARSNAERCGGTIDDHAVDTQRHGDHIVAWTRGPA